MRVLIVEDDEIFRQFLAEVLVDRGNEVICSSDGNDGYRKAETSRYDLILLDVRTPGLSGTEIAKALKQTRRSAKVVLISAFADASLRRDAADLGTPLLSKPFSPADLFEVIERTTSEQA